MGATHDLRQTCVFKMVALSGQKEPLEHMAELLVAYIPKSYAVYINYQKFRTFFFIYSLFSTPRCRALGAFYRIEISRFIAESDA